MPSFNSKKRRRPSIFFLALLPLFPISTGCHAFKAKPPKTQSTICEQWNDETRVSVNQLARLASYKGDPFGLEPAALYLARYRVRCFPETNGG